MVQRKLQVDERVVLFIQFMMWNFDASTTTLGLVLFHSHTARFPKPQKFESFHMETERQKAFLQFYLSKSKRETSPLCLRFMGVSREKPERLCEVLL